ncbi:hypothetical protein Hypma_007736 [Hypsizygus marmoreus]|uniref:Uncharacterized protein n=1 Tax=Hypsizygus marmoreus TaxID=39966 RepID=A0A369JRM0_HYPMA|nr:hypothetical protein Hypma_007736 [Hypsizygus marmoreus]
MQGTLDQYNPDLIQTKAWEEEMDNYEFRKCCYDREIPTAICVPCKAIYSSCLLHQICFHCRIHRDTGQHQTLRRDQRIWNLGPTSTPSLRVAPQASSKGDSPNRVEGIGVWRLFIRRQDHAPPQASSKGDSPPMSPMTRLQQISKGEPASNFACTVFAAVRSLLAASQLPSNFTYLSLF